MIFKIHHVFVCSTLDGGGRPASPSVRCPPGGRSSVRRSGFCALEKRNILSVREIICSCLPSVCLEVSKSMH